METINGLENLTQRKGERPQTGPDIPHLQHTDNSSVELFNELAEWLFSLELIEERPTVISVRGARAAWIKDDYPNANFDVLKTGREFTHIHPLDIYGGGSHHLSLRRKDCETVIEKGWGEYHPLNYRIYPNNDYGHIMVYAPRNKEELEAIKMIAMASYKLVTNQI
ncbi:hypothetical protein [uncultured Psychroserpens sp.]|uniref:luciferase domain-containing protein n=1 Tax=uncultured Psychroserpens sp. TaxID=255436 RepID=UPI0026379D0F|nr:hypothetical protein [uncultured Psychroserpens sp.]